VISWFYELTPGGLALDKDRKPGEPEVRVVGRRTDLVIIAMLSAAVILFAYDKWWPSGPMDRSIAVLPFENLSGDPGQEYFADGISEEILNLLAQINSLKVIARTSSFSFKGKQVDIAAMAAQLHVRHILEGSVRRSGDRLRITAQLIDAADSTHVWSQTYDRDLGDIFAIQDEIAAAIGQALKLQLKLDSGAGGTELPHSLKTVSMEAYDAYLKGRGLFRRRGGNIQAAIAEFERALRLDESFAPAHAQLAIATAFLGLRGKPLEEVIAVAAPHLDRAEALSPGLAEVQAGRALLAEAQGDFEGAIEHGRKAVEINPSYGDALNWVSMALQTLGRYEENNAVMEQMLSADPLDYVVRFNYAEWLYGTGRIKEAWAFADQVLAEDARWGNWTLANLSIFYAGQLARGLDRALRVPHRWWASRVLSWVGEYDEARRMLPDASAWVDADQGDWTHAVNMVLENEADDLVLAGVTLFQAGRVGEALPFLERAFAEAPEGRPITAEIGLKATILLAEARRQSGDEQGAQRAADIARADLAAQRSAGSDNNDLRVTEAMLAAFDKDFDRVIQSLEKAMAMGLRNRSFHFMAASFERYREEPRFARLVDRMSMLVEEEHEKVLQLICYHNPAPDEWWPLPETCMGVAEQPL